MSNRFIPIKPETVTWTDDQWKAIFAKNQDILVAAAAGSGKTAVLVERIIQKIISTDEPTNVDELLVVTFTNASAAEMRHRIGEALEKAINDNPKSTHLRKQLTLLNRASISTLHSFCLEVIRKNYYLIDIDPGFRIGNDTEVQLIRDEVLDELFEDEYGKEGNESFYQLVDMFSNDRSDLALQDIISELYDFANANPSPEQYLLKVASMYDVNMETPLEDLPFMQTLLFEISIQLEGAKDLLNQGMELTKLPAGPYPRAVTFTEDIQLIDTLIQAKNESWSTLYEAMQTYSFEKIAICRGEDFDKGLVEKSQKIRDKVKKIVNELKDELFSRRPESFLKDMKEMQTHIETLMDLVRKFSVKFSFTKREKGLVDFADLEHMCLQILTNQTSYGQFQPSEVALSYQRHYKEVLVDEYQDVNMVQETILRQVSKAQEASGNLFMVGDVKQSIYRFRLAEPNLFLGKYIRFQTDGEQTGLRIDLAKNFRSRKEVLHGTNFLFKQLMGVKVGEIEYDEAAELKQGAPYPDSDEYSIEVILVDLQKEDVSTNEENSEENETEFNQMELEQAQLEARVMAQQIKQFILEHKQVYQAKSKSYRAVTYRDFVILLRSMTWAPQIMEEFKQQGIPIYANLSSGYFEATEVAIMMSLLKIIDNPYQDIPLVSVLRSPIVGLNEEELGQLRSYGRKASFFESLLAYSKSEARKENNKLFEQISQFLSQLNEWRIKARQGALSDLIWQLYRDTYFYDFVGGMPGGKQRQANLRALYDRARQYEQTSFRGLFRFLRFVERMTDRGDDLGAARSLGEQEDVVRIMTVHSSKGLEFPFVFIAGLARNFNTLDLKKSYMLDKDFGFAAKYINPEKRISYPSLPQLAFKRKKKLEMIAEEMRVLYVALTRAKEKLFLVSSVKDLEKKIDIWGNTVSNTDWLLKEYERYSANGYLDWIGPALIRHRDFAKLRSEEDLIYPLMTKEIFEHPSCWKMLMIKADELKNLKQEEENVTENFMDLVEKGSPVPIQSEWKEQVYAQLNWNYSYMNATNYRSKQSVSEMKRQREIGTEDSGQELLKKFQKPILKRPKFLQAKSFSPAEKGTILHLVMQHIQLEKPITFASLSALLEQLVTNELLTMEQIEIIDINQVIGFFETGIGQRLLRAEKIQREVPFSFTLPAQEVYPNWKGESEPIFIQGVIDCVFEDSEGPVLLDYKTDGITDRFKGGFQEAEPILKGRYQLQIELYSRALEQILKKPIREKYLYFFDGAHVIKM
ncbi:helicase-exonuclease AddAB subunit AddA [Bacillus sp. CGMCC 1.16607]|uniref:helicase-exonuclease AddAB subunit AddA n=1 Tax=Bacillus sp. CGMCC 1.16607 TaxID=3351842 RepID=UPI00363FDB6B